MAPQFSPVADAESGAVIIVTYNSREHIGPCLASLAEHAADWEQIVVDNGSRDGTVELVAGSFPTVRLIRPNENLGFAGGCNAGAATAPSAAHLLFLNPDTILEAGSIDAMRAAFRDESVGAVGACLVDERGGFQHGWAVRRFPSFVFLALDLCLVNRLWPGNPVHVRVENRDFDPRCSQVVDQPAGAALLVRSDVFAALGGFDARFHPLWFEDVDLCLRIRASGRSIWYAADARLQHVGGHSLSSLDEHAAKAYWYANLIRYARKHFKPWQSAILRGLTVVGSLMRALLSLSRHQHRAASALGHARLAWRATRHADVTRWYA